MKKTQVDPARADRFAFGKQETAEEIMLLQAAELAGLGYFSVDIATNRVDICSERHAAIFGLTPTEFVERASGLNGSLPMVHPEDRDALRDGYKRVRAGETVQLEYRFKGTHGEFGHIVERVAPEYGPEGTVIRALGSSQDVTEARAREALELHSERLETLGVLTAGVAHDFNNILAVVMGNAQLGQAHDPTVLMQEILGEIVVAAERGARLTKSLLSFAQRATIVPREVRLHQALRDVLTNFERKNQATYKIETRFCEEDPSLLVDRDQFAAVIENILRNAVEASHPGGTIRISTQVILRDGQDHGSSAASARLPDTCIVTIRDFGHGIPADILHRITEPFFTTKNRAEGSGLGLSMAHGFAQQSGGSLDIHSDEGGTKVTLSFPQLQKVIEPAGKVAERSRSDAVKRVLLLEDDPSVSNVLRRQLEKAGYDVTDMQSAEDVLRSVRTETFDVAVFDNMIPGPFNGVDVASKIRKENISLPIILLTGMPTHLSDQHLGAVDALLHKPVGIETLVEQIERCANAHPD